MRITLLLTMLLIAMGVAAQERPNGKVLTDDKGKQMAWDARDSEWVDLETFWLRYAERSGGLTYGRTAEYPPYDQVSEYDLLLVEVPQGVCLMEFFHRRWRRANDVRRWDDAFNEYGGCPYVFD